MSSDQNKMCSQPYRPEHKKSGSAKIESRAGKLIEESGSACSPIVPVVKKDGSIQFCVDYCKANNVSLFDAYLMS